MGKAVYVREQEVQGKSLHFPLNFVINLKLPKKLFSKNVNVITPRVDENVEKWDLTHS